MMNWGNYGWGIWMLVFWVLVVAGIVYLVQAITNCYKKTDTIETALDIMKKRFAR